MTLLEKLNKFPPFLCRLAARKQRGRVALSERDIAVASGLTRQTVRRLSRLACWDTVSLATVERFSTGCGVNLLAVHRHVDWLKRRLVKAAWHRREKTVRKLLSVKLKP